MTMRRQPQQTGERGLVSLFTCILISLLLLVVTTSMVSLEALQLRKASDAEQSLRAYYTAEAGIEDAVSKVLTHSVTSDQLCGPASSANTGYDSSGAAGWTCQQITFSGTPFGKLDNPEVVKTVDPGPSSYKSVIVQWNQSSQTSASFYNMPLAGGFPTGSNGATNYVAPLELSIVEYPVGGFKSSDVGSLVKLQNVVLVPGGPAAAATVDYSAGITGGPYVGNCAPMPRLLPPAIRPGTSTSYNCYAVLTHMDPSKVYLFRIRSKYTASAYQLTFKSNPNGNGNTVVTVPDGTATIDVTAAAGKTYRRVISKLPLNHSASAGLNYVMFSDTDICKNFDVINNVAQSPPGC